MSCLESKECVMTNLMEIILQGALLYNSCGKTLKAQNLLFAFLFDSDEINNIFKDEDENYSPMTQNINFKNQIQFDFLTDQSYGTVALCLIHLIAFDQLPNLFRSHPYEYFVNNRPILIDWSKMNRNLFDSVSNTFSNIITNWPYSKR